PVPMPAWSDSEIVRLLAMSSPPTSPLSPWSSQPPHIPFPPLPPILSPPLPELSPAPPPSLIRSLGYRAAMIRLRAKAASTSHSPPLQLPAASRREDRPEVTLPTQKRIGIALGPRYEVGESSYAAAARPAEGLRADYGFVTTMDREIMRNPEREARMSREAWVRSINASDLVRGKVMTLRTIVLGLMLEIRELQVADRRRQTVISGLLRTDHRRSTEITELRTALQGQVIALQGQVTALQAQVTALQGQQGLAGGPTQPELPEKAELKELPVFPNGVKVSSLSQWCERMESTVGHEAAYGMSWKTLMKLMTEKYCPRNEIKKLEMELWDLKVKGLPDMIHGSVVASKPKTMQEAIEIETELMDKKIRTFDERQTVSKRKFENTSRNTQNQQQHSNKRQNTGRVTLTS
nr:hypothetical protein [Tanacetum cinerariifolium]